MNKPELEPSDTQQTAATLMHEVRERVYADDLVVGQVFTVGSYVMTREEIMEFAGLWDPQYTHVDEARALNSQFGGIIASGLHTLCVFQRLAVKNLYYNWAVVAGRRIREIRYRKPVRPGTTVTGTVAVPEVWYRSKEPRALVTKVGKLVDDDGDEVLSMTVEAYMGMRPRATWSQP